MVSFSNELHLKKKEVFFENPHDPLKKILKV